MNILKPIIVVIIGFINFIAQGQVTIHYTNQKATSITIISDCSYEHLIIRLQEGTQGMLGSIQTEAGAHIFTPVLPFSPGYTYEVVCSDQLIATFSPKEIESVAAEVLAIFPFQNTVPENLLKMHIRFSQPMGSGNSYQHITIKENGKPVKPFLELEAELWNEDHTVFTLWFDPGRIKRELAPNQLYGNPLMKGREYEIVIDSQWRDQNNRPLMRTFTHTFFVGDRDELLPSPEKWKIQAHNEMIKVTFNEPLDYLLINHSISLWKGEEFIPSQTKRIANVGVEIIPDKKLMNGKYTLKVDSKLEDLAGNNLSRPFDRDLSVTNQVQPITEILITLTDNR